MRAINRKTLSTAAVTAALLCGCHKEPSSYPSTIEGVWETRNVLGKVERVKVDSQSIVFNYGNNEKEYACSYRIPAFYEKENVMDIWLRCPEWTGNSGDVAYKLTFASDKKQFTMTLGDRPVAVFTAAAALLDGTADTPADDKADDTAIATDKVVPDQTKNGSGSSPNSAGEPDHFPMDAAQPQDPDPEG